MSDDNSFEPLDPYRPPDLRSDPRPSSELAQHLDREFTQFRDAVGRSFDEINSRATANLRWVLSTIVVVAASITSGAIVGIREIERLSTMQQTALERNLHQDQMLDRISTTQLGMVEQNLKQDHQLENFDSRLKVLEIKDHQDHQR